MKKLARTPDSHYATSHPFDRICFGTDVPPEEMGFCIEEYTRLFDGLSLPRELRERVMGGTVARMFGLSG
jgi:predicted TIM-barrel fold metal-dependent hydrolase